MKYDIIKPVYNDEWRLFNWRRSDSLGVLNDSAMIQTTNVIATDLTDGRDVTSSMISDVTPYLAVYTKYKLKAGVVGHYYKLEFRCTDSNDQRFSDTLILVIS